MENTQIAKICHEVNRIYCQEIGDTSQSHWNESPDWQKRSAVNGVKFYLENPEATPEDSHNSWLAEKRKEGWKLGNTKNVTLKTHPCFLPYDELPENQKKKDELFISIVKILSDK